MRPRTVTTAALLTTLLVLPACSSPTPDPSARTTTTTAAPDDGIWSSCDELVRDEQEMADLLQEEPVLARWQDRLQCAEVEVPLDHADPGGRTIRLAISRLLPEVASTGVVLTNPGGPGLQGRTMPALLATSGMADLAHDLTLVGVDVRGTGGSTSVDCDALDEDTGTPDAEVTAASAAAHAADLAAANEACVAGDPAHLAHLTTQDVARDLDLVREAIGVDRVRYLGVSWGTELGAAYLSLFPERVERMLLDSMTDLRQDAPAALDDVAAAAAASGRPGSDDAAVRLPAFRVQSTTTKTALICNSVSGATDPQQVWSDHVARSARLGTDPQERTQHPVTGVLPGTSVCSGWPLAPQPFVVAAGPHDQLQIVGHEHETATPVAWARHAHQVLGGHLAVLPDGEHGGLASSPSAPAAVTFLRTGTPF